MNDSGELRDALIAGIDNEGVDGVLKCLADILAERRRGIPPELPTLRKKWDAAVAAIDNARLEFEI